MSPKAERFVAEYLIDLGVSPAYAADHLRYGPLANGELRGKRALRDPARSIFCANPGNVGFLQLRSRVLRPLGVSLGSNLRRVPTLANHVAVVNRMVSGEQVVRSNALPVVALVADKPRQVAIGEQKCDAVRQRRNVLAALFDVQPTVPGAIECPTPLPAPVWFRRDEGLKTSRKILRFVRHARSYP